MTGKRHLAITQFELKEPGRHLLQALRLDPSEGWRTQLFDLRYPGSSDHADLGQFVVSAVGDVDGDGRAELIYAVTIDLTNCYLLGYPLDGMSWSPFPIIKGLPSVDLVRTSLSAILTKMEPTKL